MWISQSRSQPANELITSQRTKKWASWVGTCLQVQSLREALESGDVPWLDLRAWMSLVVSGVSVGKSRRRAVVRSKKSRRSRRSRVNTILSTVSNAAAAVEACAHISRGECHDGRDEVSMPHFGAHVFPSKARFLADKHQNHPRRVDHRCRRYPQGPNGPEGPDAHADSSDSAAGRQVACRLQKEPAPFKLLLLPPDLDGWRCGCVGS